MGQSVAHNESSVEEILESIKKVIARDNRDNALQARQRREDAVENLADAPNDVVPADDHGDDTESILDLAEMELEDDEQRVSAASSDDDADTPLITEEVRGAMQENLAALAMISEPGARPQIVRSGETSLEGMTRELLRPMLADWLDKNLPGMVEKMVQAEIARIAGKKR
ncbi:DUF2497 domain-containing protein [Erythrobacter insulae]|uniref:DUF2497 domain-containing protein n=1 Tax=Erythrobacter insulae TaxID=2584124 RepID=A0A547PB30_9SPHN|nr:DUF2497 domain-containing protein [Erythrobacter insulae]